MSGKIYTKTGDLGSTSLFGGQRVQKDTKRLAAYGAVDELNSQIGVVLSQLTNDNISKKLLRIQGELFLLGWDLSAPILKTKDKKVKVKRITKTYITRLEREIDIWETDLPKLTNFVLPGGSITSAGLHFARTIARRSERETVALSAGEEINANTQVYLNRLSDWLFVLVRVINKVEKKKETIWKGR